MESTADVHELLAQYAEEIRSSVGPHAAFIPFAVDILTPRSLPPRQKVHSCSPSSEQNCPKD
jgi:hypothetical protein